MTRHVSPRYFRDLDGGFTARELAVALVGGVLCCVVAFGLVALAWIVWEAGL